MPTRPIGRCCSGEGQDRISAQCVTQMRTHALLGLHGSGWTCFGRSAATWSRSPCRLTNGLNLISFVERTRAALTCLLFCRTTSLRRDHGSAGHVSAHAQEGRSGSCGRSRRGRGWKRVGCADRNSLRRESGGRVSPLLPLLHDGIQVDRLSQCRGGS